MNSGDGQKRCIFCNDATDDPVEMGELLTNGVISAHHYCLLLSSNLTQNGEDDEGLLGFLPQDINNEAKRAHKMKCCYCKKLGANIGCCDNKCRKAFHLPCGNLHDCRFEFEDTFRSFCDAHHGIKHDPEHIHSISDVCIICREEMGNYNAVQSVDTPCCSKWLHKKCLMQTAHSFGYFFKCPLCNNTDTFREKMKFCGIFIPDKDGSWEEQPNAFAELNERPNRCSAKTCKCPQGREYNARNKTKYSLINCRWCGSCSIHKHCNGKSIFECNDCVIPNRSSVVDGDASHENDVGSHGNDNVLSAANVRHIDLESNSRDSANNSHSLSSSSVETVDIPRPDVDNDLDLQEWITSNKDCSEILVHTKTSCSSSTYSASTSVHAINRSGESDIDADDCVRSCRNNRSNRIISDPEDSTDESTTSETRLIVLDAFDTQSVDKEPMRNSASEDDGSEDEKVKLGSGRKRQRIPSSSSSTSGPESGEILLPKRKRSIAFTDTSSDDDENQENPIEKQHLIHPTKKKSNLFNNNNNASKPLLEDNKNKWNRKNS